MHDNGVRSSHHSAVSTSGHPGGRTPLVLVVEDDADIRIMIEQMLELRGYCVTGVRDGAEAITAIQRNPRISFLLTDIRMPGISGWELARRVVEIRPMKVMYITGWLGKKFPVARRMDRCYKNRGVRASFTGVLNDSLVHLSLWDCRCHHL